MATYRGTDGVVKVGADVVVAEVQSFDLTETTALINDNVMGDEYDTHLIGRKSFSGTISCLSFSSNIDGQGALTNGASVGINLYPEDEFAGRISLSGTVTINQIQRSNNHDNTAATVVFSFTGNGALMQGTVAGGS